ncbi:MmgE/PrpD family protein [Rhizobium leguminosarum]|nr:MmgE/PrpD family protein [Rhizobium leguminosarum]
MGGKEEHPGHARRHPGRQRYGTGGPGDGEIVAETGGRPDCTVLGFGGKAPALMAAMANGALAHCLDYDDQTPWGQHTASSIVPAVFAVAERKGGVHGKDLIAAVAAGRDIFARLRCNVGWNKDWNLSTVLAVFAAAASASRVMGLSPSQTAAAMGIATMQSSGIMEMVAGRGSDLRGMYAGFSAKGAVLAAMMAEKGVTGIDKAFEGQYGFLNTYFGGRYDREKDSCRPRAGIPREWNAVQALAMCRHCAQPHEGRHRHRDPQQHTAG